MSLFLDLIEYYELDAVLVDYPSKQNFVCEEIGTEGKTEIYINTQTISSLTLIMAAIEFMPLAVSWQ